VTTLTGCQIFNTTEHVTNRPYSKTSSSFTGDNMAIHRISLINHIHMLSNIARMFVSLQRLQKVILRTIRLQKRPQQIILMMMYRHDPRSPTERVRYSSICFRSQ
jgi:hypothetical protein